MPMGSLYASPGTPATSRTATTTASGPRLLTTLVDEHAHSVREVVVLYNQRSEIEITNDEIKTHQLTEDRRTHLCRRTPRGVLQEFYGLLMAQLPGARLWREVHPTRGSDRGSSKGPWKKWGERAVSCQAMHRRELHKPLGVGKTAKCESDV